MRVSDDDDVITIDGQKTQSKDGQLEVLLEQITEIAQLLMIEKGEGREENQTITEL